ncbi:uncharacterized protein DS421_9g274490 [Arachis hypogaea]|nr:uncharacterized protein DS421_9g274490 [Arachis hypogaea]
MIGAGLRLRQQPRCMGRDATSGRTHGIKLVKDRDGAAAVQVLASCWKRRRRDNEAW